MQEKMSDHPQVIAFPPALYTGTLSIGLLLNFVAPIGFVQRSISLVGGAFAIGCAGLLVVLAFRAMKLAHTAIDPSKPTTTIVSDGVFGLSRNPIYLSLTLLYLGITLLFNALWALLLLVPLLVVVQVGIIQREECYLERKFGDQYLRYKVSVRRWL